ncbi:hypothetical protein [Streptomyces jumonjinensis]|nr:hypothetical protein [Streptomyces jumonjinensis]
MCRSEAFLEEPASSLIGTPLDADADADNATDNDNTPSPHRH